MFGDLSTNWTLVLSALIAAVPATIAAVASLRNGNLLKTPSGTPIGKQTEQANELTVVTLANLIAHMKANGTEPLPTALTAEEAEKAIRALLGSEPSLHVKAPGAR